MFEDKTFENIMNTMLGTVSDLYPDLDTRVGSIIYNALAPVALELETVYHEMDMILDETFVETASKEYLIKHGNQLGLEINYATNAHFVGEFDVDVSIGSRFNLDKFNYTVIKKLSDPSGSSEYFTFELVCETAGSEPNNLLGDLTPITYVSSLSHAKLTSTVIYGEDEEETESFRYRIQTHVKNPPVDGNLSQYDEWLAEYDGIGKYRTVPCWNGQNTVKLLILNPENESASPELISQVQEYFDPPTGVINDDSLAIDYPQGRGMGNGQAPIGAIVTVGTATNVPVVIECELLLKDGYTSATEAQKNVEEYLESIALNKTTIAYMPIVAAIYNASCVDEISRLSIKIKGKVMDTSLSNFIDSVTIDSNEVAVLDTENSVWGV